MEKDNGTCVASSGRIGRRSFGTPDDWEFPGFWPVFPSLCDPFDNEVPDEWRDDLFDLIAETPNLTWLLLTKRIGVARGFMADRAAGGLTNVWIGASVVNQEEADRDLPKLLETETAGKRFVSYEPALGSVNFRAHLFFAGRETPDGTSPRIDQIIVGGESNQGKHKARPFNLEWARQVVRDCALYKVACFVKQLGARCVAGDDEDVMKLRDRSGSDPSEWPTDVRVQQWPGINDRIEK